MANSGLRGNHTALLTPFNADGSVDYGAFRSLIEWQIECGVDGIVPLGTTGEAPTLRAEEVRKIVEVSVETARGRVKVIPGTGSNATWVAVEQTKHAIECGVDATLQVTPYYNQPAPAGLVAHFKTLADLGGKVVLYTSPGRVGLELPPEVMIECAKHPNIVAIKYSHDTMDPISRVRVESDIDFLCGDELVLLGQLGMGAVGLIGAIANVIPREMNEIVNHALENRWDEARAMFFRYHPLMKILYKRPETNPAPPKAALAAMGRMGPFVRLPIAELLPETHALLMKELRRYELID